MMNQTENNKLLCELYNIAELSYIKHFKDRVLNTSDLFPNEWYRSKDYFAKIKILNDAVSSDTLIIDTPSYLDIIEKVDKKLSIDGNNITK